MTPPFRDVSEALSRLPPGSEVVLELRSGESLQGRIERVTNDGTTVLRTNFGVEEIEIEEVIAVSQD